MDKLKTGSLLLNAILFVLVLLLSRGCGHKEGPCPQVAFSTDTVIIIRPSTDTMHTIAHGRPQVREVRRAKADTIRIIDTVPVLYNGKPKPEPVAAYDTLYYYDSIFKRDTCIITIRERVSGNAIVWRELRFRDLHSDKWKVINNNTTVERKQSPLKVYLGADVGIRYSSPLERGGIDVAPSTSIVFSDRYMVDVGYYVLRGEITAGVKVKLSFKK